jgi:NAD(P)-dependent dehydrogenase (short-subunit alcohol dehydrogenase family)
MKHYLIVGASSGIGFSLASVLSNENQVTALSRTEKELVNLHNIIFHECDISQDQPSFPVIEGPIDGIIYCPGTINLKPFRALKPEDYLTEWNINVMGAIKTIRNYLPQLQQGKNPSIVLFSTVAVQTGMSFHASIAAAKGAVEGLTKSLAAEFAPTIRVNAVAPSLTHTPLADKLLNSEAKTAAAAERHPLKKIGSANDISNAVVYLLNAEWVTGQILHVDGGMSSIK